MSRFPLKIVTPDGTKFNGEVIKLSLRAMEGELAIMAGHIPFVTVVKEGKCKIQFEEGEKTGIMANGLLNVAKDQVLLLIGQFSFLEA